MRPGCRGTFGRFGSCLDRRAHGAGEVPDQRRSIVRLGTVSYRLSGGRFSGSPIGTANAPPVPCVDARWVDLWAGGGGIGRHFSSGATCTVRCAHHSWSPAAPPCRRARHPVLSRGRVCEPEPARSGQDQPDAVRVDPRSAPHPRARRGSLCRSGRDLSRGELVCLRHLQVSGPAPVQQLANLILDVLPNQRRLRAHPPSTALPGMECARVRVRQVAGRTVRLHSSAIVQWHRIPSVDHSTVGSGPGVVIRTPPHPAPRNVPRATTDALAANRAPGDPGLDPGTRSISHTPSVAPHARDDTRVALQVGVARGGRGRSGALTALESGVSSVACFVLESRDGCPFSRDGWRWLRGPPAAGCARRVSRRRRARCYCRSCSAADPPAPACATTTSATRGAPAFAPSVPGEQAKSSADRGGRPSL